MALLDQFDGKIDKISLQKLLFLFVTQQDSKSFHFVPYKFGCFSYQANSDMKTMSKYDQIIETDTFWEKKDTKEYYAELKSKDKASLRYIKSKFGSFNCDQLIEFTYRNYPYYALNSTIDIRNGWISF